MIVYAVHAIVSYQRWEHPLPITIITSDREVAEDQARIDSIRVHGELVVQEWPLNSHHAGRVASVWKDGGCVHRDGTHVDSAVEIPGGRYSGIRSTSQAVTRRRPGLEGSQ